MQQDPSVNRAYHFSLSSSLLYRGASSVCVTSSSGTIPKYLPSGQFVITSNIPGWLGLPVQARCVINANHLLHVASVAWCVEGTLPLNTQPSTGSQGARRSCASVLITSEAAQTPSYVANISFSVRVWQSSDPLYPRFQNPRGQP